MRTENRGADQLRRTVITPNYLMTAEGSVLIEAGYTRVLCAATVGNGSGHDGRPSVAPRAATIELSRTARRDTIPVFPLCSMLFLRWFGPGLDMPSENLRIGDLILTAARIYYGASAGNTERTRLP